ncbi:hypothetical protein [Methanosarcina acetivorans]|nr:hypothetical protein [Methanosarcina acetivorans]
MEKGEFIKFCVNNSVEITPDFLELFEKEKLLYPIKRWVYPKEYAIIKQHTFLSDKQVYDSTYSSLLELEEEIFKFCNLYLFNRINHPFDEKDKDWQQYLLDPTDNEFIIWKDYKVNYVDESGESWSTVRAQNYYSYWQIYELDGINDFRKSYFTVRFNDKENYYYRTCDKEFVEKWSRSNKNNILRFYQFESHYAFLCEFIQSYERNIFIAFKEKNAGDFLTEEELNILENNILNKCNKLMEIYDFTIDNLYEFLEVLCKKYFYEYKEKTKLQDLIKRDIWYCIQMIIYLTGDTWEDISLKIGRKGQIATYYKLYSRGEKNTLEVLFPNEREEIKERAMIYVDRIVKSYNKQSTPKYQLTNTDISNFIEFIETNDLDHFLIFIADSNVDYFSQKYKSKKNLTFYLRNLSIFIEEIIKTVGLNSIDEIRTQYIGDISGIKTILKPICKEETWWNTYVELEKEIAQKANSNNITILINKLPDEINKKNIRDKQRQFILLNILKATIIRNYYAHNSAKINNFKTSYPLLFESILNSIFIIWVIGKDKIRNE